MVWVRLGRIKKTGSTSNSENCRKRRTSWFIVVVPRAQTPRDITSFVKGRMQDFRRGLLGDLETQVP